MGSAIGLSEKATQPPKEFASERFLIERLLELREGAKEAVSLVTANHDFGDEGATGRAMLLEDIAGNLLHEVEQSLCQAVIAAKGKADCFDDFTDARWTGSERGPVGYTLDGATVLKVEFRPNEMGDLRPVLTVN